MPGFYTSAVKARVQPTTKAADGEADAPRRRRVRRRVPRPFHLSSKRQQILIFVIIAIVAATALASMLSARFEDDSAYVPAGITR
jgi:hypothetical protein